MSQLTMTPAQDSIVKSYTADEQVKITKAFEELTQEPEDFEEWIETVISKEEPVVETSDVSGRLKVSKNDSIDYAGGNDKSLKYLGTETIEGVTRPVFEGSTGQKIYIVTEVKQNKSTLQGYANLIATSRHGKRISVQMRNGTTLLLTESQYKNLTPTIKKAFGDAPAKGESRTLENPIYIVAEVEHQNGVGPVASRTSRVMKVLPKGETDAEKAVSLIGTHTGNLPNVVLSMEAIDEAVISADRKYREAEADIKDKEAKAKIAEKSAETEARKVFQELFAMYRQEMDFAEARQLAMQDAGLE
jgi:hypothetical protein